LRKGKKAGISKEDQKDLEEVIEEIRNEMHWKDEEVTDMRDELEFLREQNKIL
jgi:hypothetical protein